MGWKPKHSPSFIKFLLPPDFADNLQIPPLFVKNHLGGKRLENSILATCESGKTWAVTMVEMIGRGRYCLKQGWPEFVKDNCLEEGDFLIFWLLGNSTFFVAVYSPSGTEKKLPSSPTAPNPTLHHVLPIDSTPETSGEEDGKGEEERGDMHQPTAPVNPQHAPIFEIVMKNSVNYMVRLPVSFVREAKILGSMRRIVLTDAQGMEWPVKILNRSVHGLFLTKGWPSFRKTNNIQNGDTCSFNFLRKEGNIIHVKVLIQKGTKTGRGRNEGKNKEKVEEETDGIIEITSYPPWFTATLGRSCYYKMGLPIWFARKTRLASRKYTVLKDDAGREFRVSIKQRYNTYGYELTTGWATFREANNVDKGATCLFRFSRNGGNVVHVKVLKRKAGSRFVKPWRKWKARN